MFFKVNNSSLFCYLSLDFWRILVIFQCIKFCLIYKRLFIPDGEIIDPSSDSQLLHETFGEKWAVNKSDWLFQFQPIAEQLQQEIDLQKPNFKASYEIVFQDQNLAKEAEKVRNQSMITFFGFKVIYGNWCSKRSMNSFY